MERIKCRQCGNIMEHTKVFVSRDALIKGYNFQNEVELQVVNGVLGMDVDVWTCKHCDVSYSLAGLPYFEEEKGG